MPAGTSSNGPAKAVVFDIGGVLSIAPRIRDFQVFQRWEELLGLEPETITACVPDVWESGRSGAITEADFLQALAAGLHWSDAQVRAFMDEFWAEYVGLPNTELVQYFADLRPRYRTGLLSNSFVGARQRQQAVCSIADVTVYSHEVGISKPEPEVYALTCERLRVKAEYAIFLDDSEAYVEGARAVGMYGVVFQHNKQAIAEIEEWLTT